MTKTKTKSLTQQGWRWSMCLLMLLGLWTTNVNGQITYTQDFNGCNAASCSGWTISAGFQPNITSTVATGYSPCANSSAKSNIYGSSTTTTLAAAASLGTSSGQPATLAFSYKCINYSSGTATPAASCTFTASWATAAGGPWTVISAIANVSSTSCQNHTFSAFTPTNGQPVFIRIVAVRSAGDFWAVMDNISLTQAGGGGCSGTPSPGSTNASVNPVCASASTNLSLQNSTSGNNVTYQWYSSTNGGVNYFPIGGATSSTYSATQTVATLYYCDVTCPSTPATTSSTPVNVTMNSGYVCYCTAGAVSASFEKISNVAFNTINNPSVSTAGFEDFTGISTTVVQGSSYTFTGTISSGFSADEFIVWIDLNQDGDFSDLGEELYNSPTGLGPHSGSILIPATATLGNTIMRVRMHDSSDGPNTTPCGTSTYGQVEDYGITVTAPAPCTDPPTPGTATSTPTAGCAPLAISLNLTGNSGGAGQTYQWEESTNNATWSPIGGATTVPFAHSTSATMYYHCLVTCGAGTLPSASVLVTLNTVGQGDIYADPITLTLPASVAGNNEAVNCWTDAYTTLSTPGQPLARASRDVFYTFTTGPCNGTTTLETVGVGTLLDTYLHLLDASGAILASDDDGGVNALSLITNYNTAPNTTYHVVVEGFAVTDEGTFTLNVTETAPNDNDITGATATSNAAGNEICNGGNALLSLTGGTYGVGAVATWYTGSCGGTLVGTGTPLVSPTSTTTYYVRIEGTCGVSACVTYTLLVSSPMNASVIVPIVNLPAYGCTGIVVNNINVPSVAGATSYIWDAPNGTTFNGSNPYTSATPSANITFAAPAAAASGYHIGVQAQNACGVTFRQSQWVRNSVGVPAAITPTTATATHCASTVATFTCPAGVGATSYLWSITGDASVSGTGTTGTVTFGPGWVGGTLSVAAQTTCFTSAAKSLVLRTSSATLGAITGSVSACVGNTLPYSVVAVDGASTYAWTYPANASGASVTNVTNATFNPGFTAGNICVQVTSVCGDVSPVKCKSITTGSATVPATLTGNSNGVCGQNNQTYTCAPQAGASFIWTLPAGASGSSSTNSISVTFTNSFTTGAISVQANNACGTSGSRSITVKGAPNTPGAITPDQVVCDGLPQIVFNSSTANLAGVYSLNWVWVPASAASYFSGQGSNALTLDWNTGNASVNLTASNACGTATRALAVTSIGCAKFAQGAVVNQESANAVAVYPNPASNLINIEYTAKSNGNVVYKLVDLTGKAVAQKAMTATEGFNTTTLDLSNLSKGVYMLNVLSSETNNQIRVVVQ